MREQGLLKLCSLALLAATAWSFTAPSRLARNPALTPHASSSHMTTLRARDQIRDYDDEKPNNVDKIENVNAVKSGLLAAALAVALVTTSVPTFSYAYDASDYASETVQTAVQSLKDASGDKAATFKVYETIADIITEGKGVGGQINYQGVALERGYIADEDTTIYNPGLSLLTDSEKERLVDAVIDARRAGLKSGSWDENNELGFEFLREKLDPYHMKELAGFLNIVPFYGAFLYLVVLAIQQNARSLFVPAYAVGVAAFFLPIIALISLGPQ